MILVFWMVDFKPAFSLSSFTFIKRLFSSSSLSAIRVVSSAYLRLLIFLPAILIPACASWYCYWVHSMKRVNSVTISFPQKNNLALTTNQKKETRALNKQFCFVHIIIKCCSSDTIYDVQVIVQAKLLLLPKASLEPSTLHLWQSVPIFFYSTTEHTTLNRPGEKKPFNAII